MEESQKNRIIQAYEGAKETLELRKFSQEKGVQIFNLGLQHFRCIFQPSVKGGPTILLLYSIGNTYFTNGMTRCWELILVRSPEGDKGWYVDSIPHGALPACYWNEVSDVLKFLDEKKSFIE